MRFQGTTQRRGVILMVVLSLLTLFAIVGLTFVLYADAEATTARIAREGETLQQADMNPEQALAFFLGQLIYDVDDVTGTGSSVRGHSLARTMYGYYYGSGMATTGSPIITTNNTSSLNPGDMVLVTSNANPAQTLVSAIAPAGIVPNVSVTLATPWTYPSPIPIPVTIRDPNRNNVPYNGPGRLHTGLTTAVPPTSSWPSMNPFSLDDNLLVNYTWFSGDAASMPVRDPERYNYLGALGYLPPFNGFYMGGLRTSSVAAQISPYVGSNVSYTYPDLNNLFLAAVNSQGVLLSPSFHRSYATGGFGTLDPSNPNWYIPSSTNPSLKYMVLRPRPADHNGFPAPVDAGGDVKNLVGAPGGIDSFGKVFNNDSFWMDLGAPVMTAPDGTMYKPLFAPLIMDLDNRINVATAGNIAGNLNASRSNQGWFSSETNLSWLWSNSANATEWQNLLRGNLTYNGKYGAAIPPATPQPSGPLLLPIGLSPLTGSLVAPTPPDSLGSVAHIYSQVDLDGRNEILGANTQTLPIQLPGTNAATAPGTTCFPFFPSGYGSGSLLERTNHPAAYAAYKSLYYNATNNNIIFRPSDMEGLLRPNSLTNAADTGSSTLISQLLRLCPTSLGGPDLAVPPLDTSIQRRNWITTISSDLARPGLSPWILNPTTPSIYLLNATTPSLPPMGLTTGGTQNSYIPFPSLSQLVAAPAQPQPPLPPPVGSDFTPNWRSLGAALGRIDLNRSLPPFPHMANGMTAAQIPVPNARYDSAANSGMAPLVQAQFLLAMQARQQFAIDIYLRLLAVTGVGPIGIPPSTLAAPLPTDLQPRRWLAQLAANIVDYIDADEISTPFNFYNPSNLPQGLPTLNGTLYQVNPTTTVVTTTSVGLDATVPANGQSTIGNGVTTYPATLGNPDVPAYWVFGTELPRIVINEVLGEYVLPHNPPQDGDQFTVNLFVELFNPMPTSASVTTTATANTGSAVGLQPLDAAAVPLYMPVAGAALAYNPYQLVIANNNVLPAALAPSTVSNSQGLWYDQKPIPPAVPAGPGLNNNVLGTPQQARYSTAPTAALPAGAVAVCDFQTGAGNVGTVAAPATLSYSISAPNGLYGGLGVTPIVPSLGVPPAGQSAILLVGPQSNDVNKDIVPPPAGKVPGTTPWLQSPHMQYQVYYSAAASSWMIMAPPPPGSPANTAPVPTAITDNTTGVSVLLRRLANPHLPPNPFLTAGGLANMTLPPNPYITVDYVHGVPLNGYNNTPTLITPAPPASYGKIQPYAAYFTSPYVTNTSQWQAQKTVMTPGTNQHTFGSMNDTLTTPFTWLFHPDRKLISPMELLHVSGFHPHELTQRFILPPTLSTVFPTAPNIPPALPVPVPIPPLSPYVSQPYGNPPTYPAATPVPYPVSTQYQPASGFVPGSYYFQHYVPWFDQSRRLYRLFEFLDTHDGMSGVSPVNGRVPGKININTLWDLPLTPTLTPLYPQIYQALYDPSGTYSNSNFSTALANTMFQGLIQARTPSLSALTLSAADRPFVGMAASVAGIAPTTATDPQYPNGMGINHTLLTDGQLDVNALPTRERLLQFTNALLTNPQGAHPYLQMELLNKIYNRLTTRSNVYAVFVTVGFFQVTNPAASPPMLGPEIGLSEGRNVRHRMFAIVDRTNLQAGSGVWPTVGGTYAPITGPTPNLTLIPPNLVNNPNGTQTISVPSLILSNSTTGAGPTIQVGTQLVLEPNTANEETVAVTAVTLPIAAPPTLPTITANFTRPHPNLAVTANPNVASYNVMIRGNPGPWTLQPYDPRKDSSVVLYYNIID